MADASLRPVMTSSCSPSPVQLVGMHCEYRQALHQEQGAKGRATASRKPRDSSGSEAMASSRQDASWGWPRRHPTGRWIEKRCGPALVLSSVSATDDKQASVDMGVSGSAHARGSPWSPSLSFVSCAQRELVWPSFHQV